ncbi:hypothetical protein PAFU01_39950 [Pantoea ananatis]|nr:hypothetical protein PAFU01_39950 [Pantoea ananatis]
MAIRLSLLVIGFLGQIGLLKVIAQPRRRASGSQNKATEGKRTAWEQEKGREAALAMHGHSHKFADGNVHTETNLPWHKGIINDLALPGADGEVDPA